MRSEFHFQVKKKMKNLNIKSIPSTDTNSREALTPQRPVFFFLFCFSLNFILTRPRMEREPFSQSFCVFFFCIFTIISSASSMEAHLSFYT